MRPSDRPRAAPHPGSARRAPDHLDHVPAGDQHAVAHGRAGAARERFTVAVGPAGGEGREHEDRREHGEEEGERQGADEPRQRCGLERRIVGRRRSVAARHRRWCGRTVVLLALDGVGQHGPRRVQRLHARFGRQSVGGRALLPAIGVEVPRSLPVGRVELGGRGRGVHPQHVVERHARTVRRRPRARVGSCRMAGPWEQLHRRDVLRLAIAGAATAGLAPLLGCSSGGDEASLAAPTTAPFDPDVPWWLQGGFAPVAEEVESIDARGGRRPPARARRPLRPQRLEPRHRHVAALVPRRRHGARRPPRRRPGRRRTGTATSAPRSTRRRAGFGEGAPGGDGVAEQRVGHPPRRPPAHVGRGRPARSSCPPADLSHGRASTTSAAGSPRR